MHYTLVSASPAAVHTYDVMQLYETVDYPEHSLGCDGPGRTCWVSFCLLLQGATVIHIFNCK